MTHLKFLTVLAGLALLTACGGGGATPEGTGGTAVSCETNPYGATCDAEEFATERQTIAEDCRTNGEGEFCDDAIEFVCPTNVDDTLCDNTPKYVEQRVAVVEQCTDTKTQTECDEADRMTACDANEFATNCPEQKYIDKRKMTCTGEKTSDRCKPTVALICGTDGDIFDAFCTGLPTTGADRISACQTHGITKSAGGDSTCDGLISAACVMDPFEHTGCATLNNYSTALVPDFCAKDANIFAHEDCAKLGNIGDLRNMYCTPLGKLFNEMCISGNHRNDLRMDVCTDTNIFHEGCLGDAHGGKTERDRICREKGIRVDMGGHASCDTVIRADCVMDPFDATNLGCRTLGDIADLDNNFCRNTSANTGKNPFNDMCNEPEETADRKTACLLHGLTASSTLCDGIIRPDCVMKPFDNAGCATLGDYSSNLVPTFCRDTNTDTGKNPFHDMCNEPEETADRKTACLLHGLTASSTLCDGIIRPDCVMKPFDNAGCATLGDYSSNLVPTFCRDTNTDTGKNPFHSMCNQPEETTDRRTACEVHGLLASPTLCDGIIRTDCESDPFDYAGCTTLTGDLRMTFCTTTKIFDDNCLDGMNGGDTERTLACQTHGTGAMGDASCDNGRNGIRGDCVTNPFMYNGCATLSGGLVTTFCTEEATRFDPRCLDDMNGGKTERDNACLMRGINDPIAHISCPEREGVLEACKLNPFAHNGCGIFSAFKAAYCAGEGDFGVADGSATDECNVNYDNWQDSFTDDLTETTPENTNKFLPNIDLTGRSSLNLNTAMFDGRELGGDVNSGVAFYSTGADDSTSHFAGILAGTHLGKSIETTAGVGAWSGSFLATNMDTPADFTLHIKFDSREIAGIVRNGASENNYYFVSGSYTEGSTGGLITGTVRYGTFTSTEIDFNLSPKRFPISASTSSGVLRGIIGQDGAVAVFISGNTLGTDDTQTTTTGQSGWAGGFVVNPTARISLNADYVDWMRGFDVTPPATPATSTRLNQFLNAGTDRLATANGGSAPPALDFDDINSNGDTDDGVAWFSVEENSKRYHYAGIFETTDLGVPLTGETGAKAMWTGQFRASLQSTETTSEFKLEITFGNARTGTIAAFVESDANHYLLTGTYTADGVISGEVDFGEFMTDTRTPTDAVDTRKGVLSGIIGASGAVGVFTSGTAIDDDGVIEGGTNAVSGYVGGFVASPFAGAVSYRDWLSNANPPARTVLAPLLGNLNQFVQTMGNDVNRSPEIGQTDHIGQNFNVNLGSLNGDPADGFSVYYITATNDYLVGLSSTTSVGAPLTTAPAVSWDGSFVVYENGVATTTPFELTVDFTNRQLSATIGDYSFSAVDFEPDGFFGSTDIRSSNIRQTSTGITGRLQGLIGSGGAVGVFHSDNNAAVSYAGGFVATFKPAPPPPLPAVNYDNFKSHYAQQVGDRQLQETPTATAGAAFVEDKEVGGFPSSDLTFTNDSDSFDAATFRLGEAADGNNGFTILRGDGRIYRAGLLFGADLGPALDNTVKTSWSGTIYTSRNLTSKVPRSVDLDLTVDFNAGTINTTTPATVASGETIAVKGLFKGGMADNGLPVGVLGGAVVLNQFSFDSDDLPLIGLIGTDGVIGVFHGGSANDVVGGFQATPDP